MSQKGIFPMQTSENLEESSRTTLSFQRVCLWRHNNFTREIGRVACHPPPCGWQAGHSGQIVWKTLWIWEKNKIKMQERLKFQDFNICPTILHADADMDTEGIAIALLH